MAIIMLISNYNVNEPYQYLNDIIGVFSDDHIFTQNELDRFLFLTINGSVADVHARINQVKPQIAECYLNNVGKWVFPMPDPVVDQKQVWRAPGDRYWYNLVQPFKFPCNVGELTAEERQLLETIDINNPSVDSAIKKIVKDLVVANPENGIEEKDLRNLNP